MTEELPAMTACELQTTREFLGLSTSWIANKLVLNERRLVRMESGQEPNIPQVVVALLDDVYAETKETVERMIATYRRKMKAADGEPVPLYTYRTDIEYETAGGAFPSRWHRHVCARVADSVPGVMLIYSTPERELGINIGDRFTGVVSNITDFGAFVQLRRGLDGLIHVSKLAGGKRIDSVEDYVRRGDTVEVEVVDVDAKGRVQLKLVDDE